MRASRRPGATSASCRPFSVRLGWKIQSVPSRKATISESGSDEGHAAEMLEAIKTGPSSTATASSSASSCPKGGAHEWTDDDTGRFCSKCLEPAESKQKGKPKARSAKKGTAAKDVAAAADAPSKPGKAGKQTGTSAKKGDAATSAKAKPKKPKSERKMSAIDAAAKVLAEADQPMATKDLIATMAEKGYWTSPGGKTPHATLYSAILREIGTKGEDSRFTKVERGKFAIVGKPTDTTTAPKRKSNNHADGTPGPKAVSELFKV